MRTRCVALILVFASILATVTPALAANSTPESAVELSAAQNTAGGLLVGSRGGAYAYYAFQYPGGNLPIVVTLNVDRSYGSMGSTVGFNLYGPGGHVGSGQPLNGDPDSTTARLPMSQPAAGRYLIQVHNYTDGGELGFSVDVSGLVASATAITGGESPDQAPTLRSASPALSGTLTGRSAGAFAFVQIDYPGGETPLDITVTFTPRYPPSSQALGFHVWRGSELLGTSAEVQQTNDTVVHEFRYQAIAPDSLGLEIFNYGEGHTVSYAVAATGLAAPPRPVSGNTTPQQAAAITPGATAYNGAVVGQRSGAFAFFNLAHPGNFQRVRLVIEVANNSALSEGAVGFNVYDGGQLVGHAEAKRDDRGRFVATVILEPETAKTYGIQVYNYVEGVTAHYRLNALGL